MPSISNVGGSISTAVALTLLAWAIRTVRAANQRREGDRDSQDQPAQKQSRFLCRLSAAAVRLLVRRQRAVGFRCCAQAQALLCAGRDGAFPACSGRPAACWGG